MKKRNYDHLDDIESLKIDFEKKRKKIKKEFFRRNLGKANCIENTKLVDHLINELFKKIKNEPSEIINNFLVCAVGGYGRKQLAPFSDKLFTI